MGDAAFTMVPPRGDHPVHGHFWVPIDDENCWAFTFDYLPARALTAAELQAMKDGHGVHNEYVPGTYRPLANKDNDYLMDRAAQRRGETFSGVKGIAIQDASLQESMGPIVDRTKERLVSADSGIIKARRKLRKAGDRAARGRHGAAAGVDPAHHRVRSASIVLPEAESFLDGRPGRGQRHPRRPADVGLRWSTDRSSLSSCAMAATAAEARFRIDATGRAAGRQRRRPGRRGDGLVRASGRPRSGRPPGSSAATVAGRPVESPSATSCCGARRQPGRLSEELAGAHFVVMVATEDAGAALRLRDREACWARAIMTAGLVLGNGRKPRTP